MQEMNGLTSKDLENLEVGVWKGDILFRVYEESESYTGIDLSSEAIKLLKKN